MDTAKRGAEQGAETTAKNWQCDEKCKSNIADARMESIITKSVRQSADNCGSGATGMIGLVFGCLTGELLRNDTRVQRVQVNTTVEKHMFVECWKTLGNSCSIVMHGH